MNRESFTFTFIIKLPLIIYSLYMRGAKNHTLVENEEASVRAV
jgi:hypothetical protein